MVTAEVHPFLAAVEVLDHHHLVGVVEEVAHHLEGLEDREGVVEEVAPSSCRLAEELAHHLEGLEDREGVVEEVEPSSCRLPEEVVEG